MTLTTHEPSENEISAMIKHRYLLAFEHASDPDLEFIPMAVRMKLDLVGCKISLTQWQQLSPASRSQLTGMQLVGPEYSCLFRQSLDNALKLAGCRPSEDLPLAKRDQLIAWWDPDQLPRELRARWEELELDTKWRALNAFGRYVAWSLLRKGHVRKLLAALTETIMYESGDHSMINSTVSTREVQQPRLDNHPSAKQSRAPITAGQRQNA